MCSALFWPSIQAGSTCTCGVSNHTFTSPHVYAYMLSVERLPGVLLNAGTWLASTWTWLLFCTCGCLRGVVRLLHCKDVTGPLCQTAWSGEHVKAQVTAQCVWRPGGITELQFDHDHRRPQYKWIVHVYTRCAWPCVVMWLARRLTDLWL